MTPRQPRTLRQVSHARHHVAGVHHRRSGGRPVPQRNAMRRSVPPIQRSRPRGRHAASVVRSGPEETGPGDPTDVSAVETRRGASSTLDVVPDMSDSSSRVAPQLVTTRGEDRRLRYDGSHGRPARRRERCTGRRRRRVRPARRAGGPARRAGRPARPVGASRAQALEAPPGCRGGRLMERLRLVWGRKRAWAAGFAVQLQPVRATAALRPSQSCRAPGSGVELERRRRSVCHLLGDRLQPGPAVPGDRPASIRSIAGRPAARCRLTAPWPVPEFALPVPEFAGAVGGRALGAGQRHLCAPRRHRPGPGCVP